MGTTASLFSAEMDMAHIQTSASTTGWVSSPVGPGVIEVDPAHLERGKSWNHKFKPLSSCRAVKDHDDPEIFQALEDLDAMPPGGRGLAIIVDPSAVAFVGQRRSGNLASAMMSQTEHVQRLPQRAGLFDCTMAGCCSPEPRSK